MQDETNLEVPLMFTKYKGNILRYLISKSVLNFENIRINNDETHILILRFLKGKQQV